MMRGGQAAMLSKGGSEGEFCAWVGLFFWGGGVNLTPLLPVAPRFPSRLSKDKR